MIKNPQPIVLSKNQEQILLMLSSGYTSSEIITILGISSNTYQGVTKRIRKKLGACNISQALSIFISNGYLLHVSALNFSSVLSKILVWKKQECSVLEECVDKALDNSFHSFNFDSI